MDVPKEVPTRGLAGYSGRSTAKTSTFSRSAASIACRLFTLLLQTTIKGIAVCCARPMQALRNRTGRLVGTKIASNCARPWDWSEILVARYAKHSAPEIGVASLLFQFSGQ